MQEDLELAQAVIDVQDQLTDIITSHFKGDLEGIGAAGLSLMLAHRMLFNLAMRHAGSGTPKEEHYQKLVRAHTLKTKNLLRYMTENQQ